MKPQKVPAFKGLTPNQLHAIELRKARKIALVTTATDEANTDHYIAMLDPANGITPCPFQYEMDGYTYDEIYELKVVWFSRIRELCQLPDSANWADIQNHFETLAHHAHQMKEMETENMKPHTPFEQLSALEQAWQLGFECASKLNACEFENPFPENSEAAKEWDKGFDNKMDLLYPQPEI